MFGSIGMPELVMIFIVALLVFGPKKLPEIGKSIGKGLAEFKRASDELKKTIEHEIEQGKHEAASVREQVAGVFPRAAPFSAEATEGKPGAPPSAAAPAAPVETAPVPPETRPIEPS